MAEKHEEKQQSHDTPITHHNILRPPAFVKEHHKDQKTQDSQKD